MDVPPLALIVLQLSPPSCIPSYQPVSPLTPVPSTSIDYPALPANFSISPSPHYPAPFGTMSLGETFKTQVRLSNTSSSPVRGVKMMIEVQGPNGRYRLGEVVHDDGQPKEEGEERDPEMEVGGGVDMDVGGEMKDVGVNLLICSIAWETDVGRKTFQRFFKFNVSPPLAIKTRIHSPTSPSVLFDPSRRSDIHLEILVQNTSMAGLAFDKVVLEPVKGLLCRPTTNTEYKDKAASSGDGTVNTLFPDDTRQYLFTLSPDPDYSPKQESSDDDGSTEKENGNDPVSAIRSVSSVFPPKYVPGTILPLGRLDVAWFSAPFRSPGRLQTSTLNRRVNVPATMTRPTLASRTSTLPVPGQSPLSTSRSQTQVPQIHQNSEWEYDLVLLYINREVEIESQFEVSIRVAVRSTEHIGESTEMSTPSPRLAIQYLSHPISSETATTTANAPERINPTMVLYTPTRTSTPLSPSGRPFSPPGVAGPSRPMTPVSSQLRQATTSSIGPPSTPLRTIPPPNPISTSHSPSTSFPPPPYLSTPSSALQVQGRGRVTYLGGSLIRLPEKECIKVKENFGTTYNETTNGNQDRWEAVHEAKIRFMALEEGMSELGGLRLLMLDQGGHGGGVVQEWETLGDVWVTS